MGGPITVKNGGTGAECAEEARFNLGLGSISVLNEIRNKHLGETVSIEKGGTGATTASQARQNLKISLLDQVEQADYVLDVGVVDENQGGFALQMLNRANRSIATDSTNSVLKLTFSQTEHATSTNNFVQFTAQNETVENVFGVISSTGDSSVTFSAASTELTALWLPTSLTNLNAGDVVGVVGGQVVEVAAANAASLAKIGVVSAQPILLGNYRNDPTGLVRVTFFWNRGCTY